MWDRFEIALNKVIASQPMLRMVLTTEGKQKFLKDVYYKIKVIDMRNKDQEAQELLIKQLRCDLSHEVMDVLTWPLYKLIAVRINDSESMLIFSVDLLTMDAASVQMFKHLVMQAYENPDQILIEPDFSFRDFVYGLELVKQSKVYDTDALYWKEKAKDFPLAPQLSLLMPVEEVDKPVCKRLELYLDKEQWADLKNRITGHGVSASTALCIIYTAVMSYYSNQPSCAINMTTFNRFDFHKDVDKIIGDFTSTMLLGMDFSDKKDFWTFAKTVQNEVTENLEHRSFSGMDFIKEVRQHKKIGKKAAVPIVFTSTLSSSNVVFDKNFGEMTYGVSQTSQVYIDCQVMEHKGGIAITWDYVEQLFDENTINEMFLMFAKGLEVLNDNTKLEDLFNVNESVYKAVDDYNNTVSDIPSKTLHGLFEESVKKYPESIAVKDTEGSLTYSQLDKLACKVALALQKNGVGRGDFVGVKVHRQKETIADILGVLKAGAAYVPIDPNHPEKRQNEILVNSKCRLCIEKEYGTEENSDDYENLNTDTSDIAYVIYTSGSTGKPKGVVITHDAAANTIQDINTRFNVGTEDNIIGLSSMCFDLSVYDIFGSLAAGATLVMVPDIHDVRNIIGLVKNEEITIWNSVPAVMQMYVDELDYIADRTDIVLDNGIKQMTSSDKSLRLIMLSGDWIPLTLPEKVYRQIPKAELFSLGGATEASIWSIYYPINEVEKRWKSIPYGMPLANQTFYVIGYNNLPCPIGTVGELCIGGRGVALEYHNDQEKTNASYFEHSKFGRLYRTGDYGILKKEGYIEFLGRKDTQVKIRGHRIELGEVETAIRQLKGVKDAAAIVKKSDNNTLSIFAFVVYEGCLDASEMKDSIAEFLPKYMVPSSIMQIDKIPLTSNEKVDRNALDKISISDISSKFQEPVNEIESKLLHIWCEVLGADRISTNSDFYDIGGDSIKLFSIVARSEEIFGVAIPQELIFSIESIKDMALIVEDLC